MSDTNEPEVSDSEDSRPPSDERMLLTQANGKQLVKTLEVPELEVELERAIWQVETAIAKGKEDQSKSKSQ
jgi:hypothetical protein